MSWNKKVIKLSNMLSKLKITDGSLQSIETDEGFLKLKNILSDTRKDKKTIYAIGNGASASMASHFAADLAKNGQFNTQVFFDISLITAISNDLSYDEVFSEPLKRRGCKGDLLVAISSSGGSKNILNAVNSAKELGIKCISFSAMNPNNSLRKSGDVNVYIPAETYGDAESCHAAILHYWIDSIICIDGS